MDGSCEITRIPTPVKEETNFAVSNDKRQQNSGKRWQSRKNTSAMLHRKIHQQKNRCYETMRAASAEEIYKKVSRKFSGSNI